MMNSLFETESGGSEPIGQGAVLLHQFAGAVSPELVRDLSKIEKQAPFRHMVTPGGYRMSVAMTNCGPVGWVSTRAAIATTPADPLTSGQWPAMPSTFRKLATDAAAAAGYPAFDPDACLINRYEPGARLTLHQDKDEIDYDAPIVSVSLGLPAVFLFGGNTRKDRPRRMKLESGDVVVWGGTTRLAYHGVAPLKPGEHPLTGPFRINLTFRKAL